MIVKTLKGNVEDAEILNIFDSETDEVSKQFKRCCSEEKIRVLLLKGEDNNTVGFCGFFISKQEVPPMFHFMFSVEYVFIKPEYRNNKFSYMFRQQIADNVKVFVAENRGNGEHILISRADIISVEGVKFMERINQILKSVSDKNGFEFINATP
ncbi:hypothetical protein [Desulfopila sp. IMCC35008]|uniref:hypothetical protein n=1 Tax=Desulfopila sp. IMCC35008 TaxID=2653858 RepID=UPI0013CF8588|nr:hypothetical protein [Desulfopila sp. IMCC35008]